MLRDGLRHLLRSARGFSPDTRRFLLGMGLMGFGLGATHVHLNLFLAARGFSEGFIGRVLSAASIGVALVSLPAASWVERWPAARIFTVNAAGYSTSLLLMVLYPEPWVVLPLSLLSGALFAVHWVAEAPFFAATEGKDGRTELFGIASALESAAVILAAWGTGILARFLAVRHGSEAEGLRAALGVAAAASLLAVLPFSRIGATAAVAPARGWRERLRSPAMGLILRVTFPAFLLGLGAGLTVPFLNLYFRNRFGRDPADVGFYFAVAQVLTTAGFLIGPMLARRFGHVRAAIATELLSIPFFLVLAVTDRLWLAVGAFWLRGALMNMNGPVTQAFAMEIIPPSEHASANAVRSFGWNASWMLSTLAGGWLIERHGFAPGMFATIGCYLVSAALFWRWFRGAGRGAAAR